MQVSKYDDLFHPFFFHIPCHLYCLSVKIVSEREISNAFNRVICCLSAAALSLSFDFGQKSLGWFNTKKRVFSNNWQLKLNSFWWLQISFTQFLLKFNFFSLRFSFKRFMANASVKPISINSINWIYFGDNNFKMFNEMITHWQKKNPLK